jgi:hypothetical protein
MNPRLPQSVIDRALSEDPAKARAEFLSQWRAVEKREEASGTFHFPLKRNSAFIAPASAGMIIPRLASRLSSALLSVFFSAVRKYGNGSACD